MNSKTATIQISKLTKKFGNLVAVNDLNLEINRGELLALLGPNGAGKTTTINILCCLLKPTSGTVQVLGNDVVNRRQHVKKVIGVCPQETVLSERLNALENLEVMGKQHGMSPRQQRQAANSLLEQLGLLERARDRVSKFSGGMRRRLSLAMALLHDPEVIFLDEPTLGLDPQARRAIWNYINGVKGKKTILLTTNYMDEADELSDRIGIIDKGKLVALGTNDQLKTEYSKGRTLNIDTAGIQQELLSKLQEKYSQVTHHGKNIRLSDENLDLKEVVDYLYQTGVSVSSISFEQATLEDVFLSATGRELRD
jgi:ABC-2 type transport system ATP-binding protein